MFVSSLTRRLRALRDWIRSRSLPAWSLQAGIAGGCLLVLFGMQGPFPRSARKGADQQKHPVSDVAWTSPLAVADGEEIYNTRCVSCHQMNGQGVPGTFPPLNETKWVNGDKGRLIRILLNGLQGSIKVKGRTYSGIMPPWGGALSNKQIAQVATYIRTNFGNDSSPVTAEAVKKVRKATSGRKSPWTAKALKKKANQGIPEDSTAGKESSSQSVAPPSDSASSSPSETPFL